MGALLSGLIGAAGADIEKQADRAYQEKRQERADRMKILELAISNPNYDINRLPKDFGELDDLAKDAKYKTQQKDQFSQMGGMVQKIFHRRKQQQQQQAGQQQAQADVAGAPGVTAQPQSQQQQPAGGQQMTAPPPPSRFLTREQQQAQGEQGFQTELKHTGQASQAAFDQKVQEVEQLVKQGYDKPTAQQMVFGRTAAPPSSKFSPFYISGKNIPPDVQVDALGNAIDRQGETQYKMEEGNPPKFYPASSAPAKAGGGADELAKMAKIILAKKGIQKPTEEQAAAAAQQAGQVLFQNKVLNPQERIELTKNAVRNIVGEQGVLQVPTHAPGAGGGRGVTPPMPSSRVIPFGEFNPEIKGTERTRKDNAEVIMTRGGSAIATLQQMSREHPEWTGLAGSTWTDIQKKFGTADPKIGQMKGAMESLVGFLPSLHGFRSKSILDSWKATLDNPLKNPPLTQSVIREVMKAAQELRDTILKRSTAPMTAEGEEEKATQGKGGDLSGVSTQDLLKRLAGGK